MIDKILLQRYAEAGARRIVDSGCKLEAVSLTAVLTAVEKEWALDGQSVERQLENASEIVQGHRSFWVVTIVDGVVFVSKPPKVMIDDNIVLNSNQKNRQIGNSWKTN